MLKCCFFHQIWWQTSLCKAGEFTRLLNKKQFVDFKMKWQTKLVLDVKMQKCCPGFSPTVGVRPWLLLRRSHYLIRLAYEFSCIAACLSQLLFNVTQLHTLDTSIRHIYTFACHNTVPSQKAQQLGLCWERLLWFPTEISCVEEN